jgi:hypothetical protein
VLSNDYNGVIWARLADLEADRVIAAIVNRFRKRNLWALWHLDQESRPIDLAQRLEAYGCMRLEPGVCMAADLFALNETTKDIPGLTIERVVDNAGLSAWMDIWMQVDDGVRETRERLYESLGLSGEQQLRHYLARLDGWPVAISQLFLGGEAAGIYCVTSIPEVQRRGIGTAVTLAPLLEARALGYHVAVLGPTPEGQHMYARMGFELFPSPLVAYALWNDI